MNERILIIPKVCHGQACIRGTRIPVHQIVRMFADGDSVETLLRTYPSITREDIMACLDYAASLPDEQRDADEKAFLDDELQEFRANPNAGSEWKKVESRLRRQIR